MRMRHQLSVAILTKNDEKCIGRCLDSVKWADEIVILDGFSSDRTVEICKQYTPKIHQKTFEGFSVERDYILKQTSHTWVLSLDADMVCTEDFCDEVKKILENPDKDGYRHRVLTVFLGREIRHCTWYNYRFMRLFNKEKGRYNPRNVILDAFVMNDTTSLGTITSHILHYPREDFITYFGKIKRYSFLTAHEYRHKGLRITHLNALFYLMIKPGLMFLYKYILKLGFLDGIPGLIVCGNSMISYFVAYAALWDMQRTGTWSIDSVSENESKKPQ